MVIEHHRNTEMMVSNYSVPVQKVFLAISTQIAIKYNVTSLHSTPKFTLKHPVFICSVAFLGVIESIWINPIAKSSVNDHFHFPSDLLYI